MYRTEDESVRGQRIKVGLIALILLTLGLLTIFF